MRSKSLKSQKKRRMMKTQKMPATAPNKKKRGEPKGDQDENKWWPREDLCVGQREGEREIDQ